MASRALVVVAMEEEAQYLRPLLRNTAELPMRGIVGETFTRGYLENLEVDIVISGIGAVHAASATTAALLANTYTAVLSCGCSGAHALGQKMGDLVLGTHVMPLDAQVISRDGSVRFSGVRYSMTTKGTVSWPADASLIALAREAAQTVRREQAPAMTIMEGTVGSGDAWRQSPSVINEVAASAKSLCEEMEAHAVALVCDKFDQTPFLAIKDIANSELEPDDIQLEPTHHEVPSSVRVGYNAALVTFETLRKLAQAPMLSNKRPAAEDNAAPTRVTRSKC